MSKTAWIFLAPGFEEVEAVTPIDYLRRAGIEVTVVSLVMALDAGEKDILAVTGAHGISIRADTHIVNMSASLPDCIITPGGMPGADNIAASAKACELLGQCYAAGKLIASICASPIVVLEKLGILSGKTYTCFPGMDSASAEKSTGNPTETCGNVITGKSAGCAAHFSLAIIASLLGAEAAEKIKNTIHLG
ncbi:MAG: DJ-1/PfpI family protein [Treponemataceae bacterium]|nr:MAG: DJ-1/PfpI family protein [Treponemataceae bacterium]